MAEVEINIIGKKFDIICADGQEDHVKNLIDFFSKRLMDVDLEYKVPNQNYQILLAALLVCDDYFAIKAENDKFKELENRLIKLNKSLDSMYSKVKL